MTSWSMSLPGLDAGDPSEWEGYDEFDSGLTFPGVREMLAEEQKNVRDTTGHYMFVSRSTVLGRMRQLKMEAFRRATEALTAPEWGSLTEHVPEMPGVPYDPAGWGDLF